MNEASWDERARLNPWSWRKIVVVWTILLSLLGGIMYGIHCLPGYIEKRSKEMREQSLMDQAHAMLQTEKENNFRSCIRAAAGQVGVATNTQIEKCKQQHLDK